MLVRIIASGIAAAIVFFFGGWVLYGLLLRSYFDSTLNATAKSVMNTDPNFVPLVLAEIAFGLLFAYILIKWASMRTLVGGAIGGATIIFLMSLGFDFQMQAFFKEMHVGTPYVPMVADLACAVILGALAGGGKGAAIGALAGGGAGAATQVLTRGRALHIPPETVLRFRLECPIYLYD